MAERIFDESLLPILADPRSKKPLVMASETVIRKANEAIAAGTLRTVDGEAVTQPVTSGLYEPVDGFLYRIDDGIPNLIHGHAVRIGAHGG